MVFALMCITALSIAAEIEPPSFWSPNEELRGYLLEAAENSPGLRAKYEAWHAALERIPQATALDDPMLSFTAFAQSMDSQYVAMLEQSLPWFGTLRERGNQARADADAALAMAYAMRNEVFAEVKRAYFEYGYLAENIRLTQKQLELLQYMEEIVRVKYAFAMASQEDLIRTQIEQSRMQDRLTGLNQMQPAVAAQLNKALGRAVDSPVPEPQTSEMPPSPPSFETILAAIRENNPELAALQNMIESREHGIKLAKKMRYPEITLGIGYGEMKAPSMNASKAKPVLEGINTTSRLTAGGMPVGETIMGINTLANLNREFEKDDVEDEIMVSFRINMPIWRKKIRAGIHEAEFMRSEAEFEKQEKSLSLEQMARMTLFEIEDAQRRWKLYTENLIPQAEQSYESIQSGYGSGAMETDFLDVLGAVQMLLEFELENAMAIRDLQIAAADLEMLMGGRGETPATYGMD